jgi:hypothetical protein
MRFSSYILIFAAILVAGDTQQLMASDTKPSDSILGTWEWVRIAQLPVDHPVYMRFYPDGNVTEWLEVDGKSPTNSGGRGPYHFDGNILVMDQGSGRKTDKVRVEIRKDEMTLSALDNDTNAIPDCIYRRVVPDLDPGKFPPSQSTNSIPKL